MTLFKYSGYLCSLSFTWNPTFCTHGLLKEPWRTKQSISAIIKRPSWKGCKPGSLFQALPMSHDIFMLSEVAWCWVSISAWRSKSISSNLKEKIRRRFILMMGVFFIPLTLKKEKKKLNINAVQIVILEKFKWYQKGSTAAHGMWQAHRKTIPVTLFFLENHRQKIFLLNRHSTLYRQKLHFREVAK